MDPRKKEIFSGISASPSGLRRDENSARKRPVENQVVSGARADCEQCSGLPRESHKIDLAGSQAEGGI